MASWLALAALVAGVPLALYAVSGSPLPHSLPSGHQVIATLDSHDNGTLFLAAIRYLTWIAWACFALSALVEAISRARGHPAPRLPVIGPVQGVAAALIGAAILSSAPFPHGLRPAQPPARPAQATAAAAPPRPGDPLQAVTTALTLPATPGLTAGTSTPSRPRYRQYEVADGDNLWDIAQRFLHDGEDWHELYQLNEDRPQPDGETLEEPGLIQPGWELLIPEPDTPNGGTRQPRPAGAGPPRDRPPSPRAPRPASSSRATSPAPGTRQHSRPRQVAVSLPSGAIIGIAVAVMVAAALTLAAIQRRRRYRPRHHHLTGSLRPAQPPPPPVIATLQRAARPAGPDARDRPGGPASTEQEDPAGDPYLDLYQPLPEPRDDQPGIPASRPAAGGSQAHASPSGFQGLAAASLPDGTRGGLPAGLDGDREAAIDIAALGGLGLAGPGAAAAARALLAALLAQAPPPGDGMPARIIIPAADARRLLPGTDAATIPGVSAPTTLDQALDELEALILGQARETGALDPDDDQPPPAGGPGAALITTCGPGTQQRLRAILQAGRPLGTAAVLLGRWPAGTTCQVAADGTVTAVTPPSAGLDGIRLFTLDPADAAAIASVLREASGIFPAGPGTAPGDQDDQPPAPAGQATREDLPGENLPGPPALPAPPAPAQHAEGPRQPPGAAESPDGGPHDPEEPQPPGTRPVRLALLGPLRVTARGEEVAGGLRKARELLALLAVHPDGISGEAVSEALWPEADAAQATAQRTLALRKARDLLRTATGMATPMWVINAAGRYRLDPALITTDLQELQDALDQARRADSSAARLAACRAIVALYRGELAEGAGYEWAEPHAETARRRVLDAWTAIAEILQASDPDQALAALEAALAHDPYNEFLYQRIMRIQAAAGRPDAVRRTLALLESRLTGLGITPGTQTRQVAASLLGGSRTPPPGTQAPHPGATDQRQ